MILTKLFTQLLEIASTYDPYPRRQDKVLPFTEDNVNAAFSPQLFQDFE